MTILLSGYEKSTQELVFRVYANFFPDEQKRQNVRRSHLEALDLLSAALCTDFGVRHGKIAREGLEKPQLLHEGLHMNLSHCRGLAVAAVGRVPLGVDAETQRRLREPLLPRLCAESECAEILSAADKSFAFTRFWTLKEAYGKYTGEGIRANLPEVEFSLQNGLQCRMPGADGLMFFQLLHESSYAVSLCVPETDCQIETSPEWTLFK